MQCSLFSFPFEIVIYHPTVINTSKNVVPPVLLLYNDTPGVLLKKEQPYTAQFPPGIIN